MVRALSRMERFVRLPNAVRAEVLAGLADTERLELLQSWEWNARPAQLPPAGDDWSVWLILAGRGFGKTRAGAEWVSAMARSDPGCRIALVGPTAHDTLAVMVQGESGIATVACGQPGPEYRSSRRTLRWPNGSVATLISAHDPDALRGPQFHYAWCDEIAAWPRQRESWDNLRMGLRLGRRPRAVVTTTPRPQAFLRELAGRPGTIVSRGSTYDNRANLPVAFIADLHSTYAGTSLGRQEVLGELLDNRAGALWSMDGLDQCRVAQAPDLRRVVVGVDPPAGPGGCGIVAVGLGDDGLAYVLADASVSDAAPEIWAAAVVATAHRFEADKVVAEVNNGGAMVESVLRAGCSNLPLKQVRAARGKAARAEPVSALYASGRVRHVGGFARLEDEMCGLMAGGGYLGPGSSPDRADALVWALTELLLAGQPARPALRSI
jgi:phage terminase large subunit-like protein